MKIKNLTQTSQRGASRVVGTIEWEDSDRAPLPLFFESTGGSNHFWPDPNAFLIACLLPAWKVNERRILVEGTLCPILTRGLRVVLAMMKSWYPELPDHPPTIESTLGPELRAPVKGPSLSLLSCGVDSTAALRWNTLNIPTDHPDAIAAVVVVAPGATPSESGEVVEKRSGGRLDGVRKMVASSGLEPIPVVTNVMDLAKGRFFTRSWHGAVFSSVASLFSNRFARGVIAATHQAPNLRPWGSSPLVDPYYGSAHFSISHDGFESSRFEKLRLISDWPEGLSNLRVCQNDDSGATNCGTCEKCVRTMLHLVILGKLDTCDAFPEDDVDEALVWTLDKYDMIPRWGYPPWYLEIAELLRGVGRTDLATAVDGVLEAAASRHGEWYLSKLRSSL